MKIIFLTSFLLLFWAIDFSNSQAQSLFNTPIRKIDGSKREIYFKEGGFYKKGVEKSPPEVLQGIRQFYNKKLKQERVVFDFKSEKVPRLYVYSDPSAKKIFLNFFSTDINPEIGAFGNGHFVKTMYFYHIGSDMLSVELTLNQPLSFYMFYLEDKQGRFVVDLRP